MYALVHSSSIPEEDETTYYVILKKECVLFRLPQVGGQPPITFLPPPKKRLPQEFNAPYQLSWVIINLFASRLILLRYES